MMLVADGIAAALLIVIPAQRSVETECEVVLACSQFGVMLIADV